MEWIFPFMVGKIRKSYLEGSFLLTSSYPGIRDSYIDTGGDQQVEIRNTARGVLLQNRPEADEKQ
jgi:hypothetical protein